MVLEALPMTPSGKIDRKALPSPEARPEGVSYVAPRTEIEEALAAIWSEVLEVEQVGVHDNFFELGGHSLVAARVITRVRDTFAVELPLRTMFELPTVEALAQFIVADTLAMMELMQEDDSGGDPDADDSDELMAGSDEDVDAAEREFKWVGF
jgi:acyl carrier protein